MLRANMVQQATLIRRPDHHPIRVQMAEAVADAPDLLDQARHEAEEQRVRQELAVLGPVLASAVAKDLSNYPFLILSNHFQDYDLLSGKRKAPARLLGNIRLKNMKELHTY